MTPPDGILNWGALPQDNGTWIFRLWAPGAENIEIGLNGTRMSAERQDGGDVFSAVLQGQDGDIYHLFVDGQERVDPAARWLQGGVKGPARLCALSGDRARGPAVDWCAAVIHELHIGTFTTEGTFAAAEPRMPDLAALGITAVEVMPVGTFSGDRGWGYDGVFPFAPHPAYGTPRDLAGLVDAIHAAGMLAILDVVYNHFGPEGGTLHAIAPAFFDDARHTPWGAGIDYTRAPVRDFFVSNAAMWVRDYGFDGLRLDAVHQIADPSPVHLLDELAEHLRHVVPDRPVHLIAEDERNLPEARARGSIRANWNDDYHHAVHCLLTGENESYYAAFAVDPLADLCRALAEGHVEQGQDRAGRDTPRGAPSAHLPPEAFINSNQTHDQVGNRAQGDRLITLADPGAVRIAHALLLTSPAIPMLFMGEEKGARAPFLFFADFAGDLGEAVRKGRAAEFAGFSQFGGTVPDPLAPETFAAAHPYARPAEDAAAWRDLTARCLTLRGAAIVPLLASGVAAPPRVRGTGARSLHAVWTFADGTLETVAHLGAVPDDPVAIDRPDLSLGDVSDPCHFAVKVTAR